LRHLAKTSIDHTHANSTVKNLPVINAKPVEHEARHLLKMADDIILNIPETAKLFSSWREEVHALIVDPIRETVCGESELDRLSMKLRGNWMKIAHAHSDPHLKSPLQGSKIRFPMGERSKHTYERLISPKSLEERCEKYRPTPHGWRSRHMLFRSGMAAITAFLQNVRPHLFNEDHEPIILDFFGGYFESKRLFDLFSSPLFSFRRHASQDQLLQAIEKSEGQLLFLEPVAYDWEMEALNLDKLHTALASRKQMPRMIVLDTTIIGDTFPMKQFLSSLPGKPPPIVMQISSGLKLDQEGLELANVGIVSVFWSKAETEQKEAALTLSRKMRQNRKITGTGLSVDEIALLDAPWFLNLSSFKMHCRSIFENNRRLAAALSPIVAASNGGFTHVSHPSLSESAHFPWAVAPFVVLHLHEELDNEENHARLITLLLKKSQINNLGFGEGMSFGFRSHRFEIIQPNSVFHPNGRAKGVLKVAMGCRQGPIRDEIIHILTTIAKSSKIPDDI
jgi:hypothetical protein